MRLAVQYRTQGIWGGVLAALSVILLGNAWAAAPMDYLGHAPESREDRRYQYHWAVLRAALEQTRQEWGPYRLYFSEPMNETRQLRELMRPGGRVTVMIRETSHSYEQRYLPVRIPIDRGLLGYRVMLIRRDEQPRFDALTGLDDWRKLQIVQGSDWGDVAVLRHAGFKVLGDANYQGLFRMMARGHGDAFSRGVTEVEGELANVGRPFPQLGIEQHWMLYYPLPTYFWFSRTPTGQRLAARAEAGMRKMLRDGSYQRLFWQYHGGLIERLKLRQRKLLRIPNPYLPDTTPFAEHSLWFDPLQPGAER